MASLRSAAFAIALFVIVLFAGASACRSAGDAHVSTDERVAFYTQAGNPDGGIGDMDRSDPDAWRAVETDRGVAVELFQRSDYAPPHRSPHNLALITRYSYGDFTLDVDARSTTEEYGHRDLCLFFGWQSPSRFYYVHLATAPDERAHNVFLVDGADRTNLLPAQPVGVDWGDEWHHLRLERTVDDGLIRVFFDDMETPVLSVTDRTIGLGHVGIGSFDDTGMFANVVIRASAAAVIADGEEPFAR